jgi:anti-sigma factor ChrR (cupin superfamily)
MQLNADFSQRIVDHAERACWTPSPAPGVERRMLDRLGDEVAVATSIVRYAPDSRFPAHRHDAGEEFLVLEGTFSDENGDYGPGTYVRNPPGSSHAPFTREGTTIFVKLRQFQQGDAAHIVQDTRHADWRAGQVPGLEVLPLHQYHSEQVALVRWAPGTRFPEHSHVGGEEILVLEGTLQDELGTYPAGTWIRSPAWSRHQPWSAHGALIYVKVGHLSGEGGTPVHLIDGRPAALQAAD